MLVLPVSFFGNGSIGLRRGRGSIDGLHKSMGQFATMMKSIEPKANKQKIQNGYVTYVLQEGSEFEKTRLVRNLEVKLALHDRKLIRI